jgi:Spy/CpxP family protein refolding chaperone
MGGWMMGERGAAGDPAARGYGRPPGYRDGGEPGYPGFGAGWPPMGCPHGQGHGHWHGHHGMGGHPGHGHHGMGHPGYGHHGMGHQGYGHHGMGPGAGWHGMGGHPAMGHPGFGHHWSGAQPGFGGWAGMGGPGYGMRFGGGPGAGYGSGPGAGWGMGPGMMMGPAGPGRLMWALDLDDKQVEELAAIHEDLRKKRWELAGKMQDEMAALRGAWQQRGEQRDRAAIVAAYKRLGELRMQMFESALDASERVEKMLNEEQRQKLRRLGPPWMSGMMDEEE